MEMQLPSVSALLGSLPPRGHGSGFLMCIYDPSHGILSCFREKNFVLFIIVILISLIGFFAYNQVP